MTSSTPPSPESGPVVRFVAPDELLDFRRQVMFGFGDDYDEERVASRAALTEALGATPLCIVAEDRGRTVATLASYDLELTVPGGDRVSTAGTSAVTVHPTHRRRGLLTQMMAKHLDQARDRGQPLAALYASEEAIYGRFGYGPATFAYWLRYSHHDVTVPDGPAEIRLIPLQPNEAVNVLAPLYEQTLARRVGSYRRQEPWWDRIISPFAAQNTGSGELRVVVAERHGQPVGYVLFRLRAVWGVTRPDGTAQVQEMAYLDDDVRRRLTYFVSNIDLMPNVVWKHSAFDAPLLLEATRPRSIERIVTDQLWVRVLDVVAALESRRYESPGGLVLDVKDRHGYTTGRYRLEVEEDGHGRCAPTTDEADVELDAAELGAVYLGHRHVHTLARAGRIHGAPSTIDRLADMFETMHAPFCAEAF